MAARRRLRLGMVGGGHGAFIGGVHRIAARLDGHYEFVAGALAADPARAKASGEALGLAADRNYPDYATMARAEAAREDRIDVVSIVTPNDSHHPVARAFLDAGIPVICDKPLTTTLADAMDLVHTVRRTARVRGNAQLHRPPDGAAGARDDRRRRIGCDPGRAGGIRSGLAGDAARRTGPEAGRVEGRSGAGRCGRLRRRYRHARAQSRLFRHRPDTAGDRRRPVDLCPRQAARRQRAHAAPVRGRRARHAVVDPGRAGQRERAQSPGLWREGRDRVAAGGAQPASLHPLGEAPRT